VGSKCRPDGKKGSTIIERWDPGKLLSPGATVVSAGSMAPRGMGWHKSSPPGPISSYHLSKIGTVPLAKARER
jgi:hypothetical protein